MAAIGIRVALAAGAGLGVNYGWNQLWGTAEGSINNTEAQVEACAQVLGQEAVMSSSIPGACSNELSNTYSYYTNHNTEYLLPSDNMVRAQLPYVPNQFNHEFRVLNDIGIAGGSIFGGALFYITRRLRWERKSAKSVKPAINDINS